MPIKPISVFIVAATSEEEQTNLGRASRRHNLRINRRAMRPIRRL